MISYQIQGPARLCSLTGRELRVGEKFYSVLVDENGQFVRKDYSAEAWTNPPEGIIAWWTSRIPEGGKNVKPTINEELLVDCFEHLVKANDPSRLNFRYVLVLLLMRRKRFKFEDVSKKDNVETLMVRDAKSGHRYEIVDPRLSEAEMTAVQEEIFRVLGWQ